MLPNFIPTNHVEVMRWTKQRYFNDPTFHAQVKTAEAILSSFRPMTDTERAVAITAAALGLAMSFFDPVTGQFKEDLPETEDEWENRRITNVYGESQEIEEDE